MKKRKKNKPQKNDKFSMSLGVERGEKLTKEQQNDDGGVDLSKIDPDFGKGEEITSVERLKQKP